VLVPSAGLLNRALVSQPRQPSALPAPPRRAGLHKCVPLFRVNNFSLHQNNRRRRAYSMWRPGRLPPSCITDAPRNRLPASQPAAACDPTGHDLRSVPTQWNSARLILCIKSSNNNSLEQQTTFPILQSKHNHTFSKPFARPSVRSTVRNDISQSERKKSITYHTNTIHTLLLRSPAKLTYLCACTHSDFTTKFNQDRPA
jgi:hypothetical protein